MPLASFYFFVLHLGESLGFGSHRLELVSRRQDGLLSEQPGQTWKTHNGKFELALGLDDEIKRMWNVYPEGKR